MCVKSEEISGAVTVVKTRVFAAFKDKPTSAFSAFATKLTP